MQTGFYAECMLFYAHNQHFCLFKEPTVCFTYTLLWARMSNALDASMQPCQTSSLLIIVVGLHVACSDWGNPFSFSYSISHTLPRYDLLPCGEDGSHGRNVISDCSEWCYIHSYTTMMRMAKFHLHTFISYERNFCIE